MFRLEGKIHGAEEVKKLYAIAPKAFLNTIKRWFYSERKKYVGNRKMNGIFRRQLMGLRHAGEGPFERPWKWPKNVVNAISGVVTGIDNMGSIMLTMGGLSDSKFIQGMAMMDVGYSGPRVISSSSNMTIPVYKNLAKLGIRRDWALNQKMFFGGRDGGLFAKRTANGTILYFNASDRYKTGARKGALKRSALLFIGKKQIKLNPKFDFVNQWETRIPAAVSRGQTLIDRTVRALTTENKVTGGIGYIKAE